MARLSLVPYQLKLFELGPRVSGLDSASGDAERDQRTGSQWLKSARDWCLWRAGDCWRRVGLSAQRFNQDRLDYLSAYKEITCILSTGGEATPAISTAANSDAALQADLDIARGGPLPLTLEEKQLENRPRAALVDELMCDPIYTDRGLLAHLPKRKLARMVTQSRERLAAAPAKERRLA